MIEFHITESPDTDVCSTFKFHRNQVYLGFSSGDLFIKDKALKPSHLMIEAIGPDLIVHPQKDIGHYLINGKRATTIRKIKIGDQIGIGQTVIKILSFDETLHRTKKEVLDEKFTKLLEGNSSKLPVIEAISKLMK
jgi:hypothetical protein